MAAPTGPRRAPVMASLKDPLAKNCAPRSVRWTESGGFHWRGIAALDPMLFACAAQLAHFRFPPPGQIIGHACAIDADTLYMGARDFTLPESMRSELSEQCRQTDQSCCMAPPPTPSTTPHTARHLNCYCSVQRGGPARAEARAQASRRPQTILPVPCSDGTEGSSIRRRTGCGAPCLRGLPRGDRTLRS